MKPQVNIVVVVDVVGALSDGTLLNGNLCMMDNGTCESTGQGTPDLCTVCQPGQIVQWVCYALDLQTPVDIKNITFLGSGRDNGQPNQGDANSSDSEKLPLDVWSGVVPPSMVPGMAHNYRLELQMYEGEASVLHIDSCALKCL